MRVRLAVNTGPSTYVIHPFVSLSLPSIANPIKFSLSMVFDMHRLGIQGKWTDCASEWEERYHRKRSIWVGRSTLLMSKLLCAHCRCAMIMLIIKCYVIKYWNCEFLLYSRGWFAEGIYSRYITQGSTVNLRLNWETGHNPSSILLMAFWWPINFQLGDIVRQP